METQGHDVSRSWFLRKLYYEAISGALDRSRTCDPPLRRWLKAFSLSFPYLPSCWLLSLLVRDLGAMRTHLGTYCS